jgi:hypothetical protein
MRRKASWRLQLAQKLSPAVKMTTKALARLENLPPLLWRVGMPVLLVIIPLAYIGKFDGHDPVNATDAWIVIIAVTLVGW